MENNFIELYKPLTLDDMVIDDTSKTLIKSYIDKGTMFNVTLAGRQGIGKSSLARIIANSLDVDLLYVNCGYENNIDVVRNKVKDFCDTVAIAENGKIVILDEADSLSRSSGTGTDAQKALRNIIEENVDDTRFILTCNYINKIIGPIQDRCTPIKVKFSIKQIAEHVIKILKSEKIKFDKKTLQEFITDVVKPKYPSIRSIVNNLEFWCVDGTLVNNGVSDDAEFNEVVEMILKGLKSNSPKEIRTAYIQMEDKFASDYEVLASELFNVVEDGNKQITIAETIYRMSHVLDKEIQFYSMILQLKNK